jgi:hypothetical protein
MGLDTHFYAERYDPADKKWKVLLVLKEDYKSINLASEEVIEEGLEDDYPYNPTLVHFHYSASGRDILPELLGLSGGHIYGMTPITAGPPRGLPHDAAPGTLKRMEGLVSCSYVTLLELLDYGWGAEVPNWDRTISEAVPYFFLRVIPALIKAADGIGNAGNVRLVYGFSY